MAAIEKFLIGTATTLMTFSMANMTNASSGVFDNTDGATGNGYILCDLEFRGTSVGGAPWAGSSFTLWFLLTQDGVTFEDGDPFVTPLRTPDAVFPLRAVNTLQIINRRVFMPWGIFKALLRSEATNTSFVGSVSIRPVTRQSA
jgi:hypothetical protein